MISLDIAKRLRELGVEQGNGIPLMFGGTLPKDKEVWEYTLSQLLEEVEKRGYHQMCLERLLGDTAWMFECKREVGKTEWAGAPEAEDAVAIALICIIEEEESADNGI